MVPILLSVEERVHIIINERRLTCTLIGQRVVKCLLSERQNFNMTCKGRDLCRLLTDVVNLTIPLAIPSRIGIEN